MQSTEKPSEGHAEVHIVAASPEVARRVAEVLRRCFAATEQRSYPAGSDGGTRLDLTVDTTRAVLAGDQPVRAGQPARKLRRRPETARPAPPGSSVKSPGALRTPAPNADVVPGV